jgi:hypothetical protein
VRWGGKMTVRKIDQLLKAYEVAEKEYDYDGGEFDEAYENADHETDQHEEFCDWIYGNCNCRKMEDE